MSLKLKRIVRSGILNFKRGGLISFASVLVITITLSVITTLMLLYAILHSSLIKIKDKVDIAIYFVQEADESKILNLKSSLEKLPEVSSVSYVSASEALANFREKHENDYPTIAALDEINENPLGAYLNVKAKEVSQYESIANFLKSDDALITGSLNIIDKINYYQNKEVIERLNSIIEGTKKLGFIVTLLFIFISILVTYNTIKLTTFISKEEIAVMRLVGASKMRIVGPFMVEGVIYGSLSSIITLFLFLMATYYMGKNMTIFLGIDMYEHYLKNILKIFGVMLGSGVLLGMISSFFAVRKYLKK